MVMFALCAVVFAWLLFNALRVKRPGDALDEVLCKLPPNGDPFTLRQLLAGVFCCGKSGSGKTSGLGNWISTIMLNIKGSGGLILMSKPEERGEWQERFTKANRENDLIIFSEDQPARCNFIEAMVKSGADARGLTQFFTVPSELVNKNTEGTNEQFFKLGESWMYHHAIEVLIRAYGEVDVNQLHRFISTAPLNSTDLVDPGWRKCFHAVTLEIASKRPMTGVKSKDFHIAFDYWTKKYPNQDSKPRSSILACVNNTLGIWVTGMVSEMIAGQTNTTTQDLFSGKYWAFDLSVHKYGDTGKLIMATAKFLVQKMILQREVKPGDATVFIYADECQNVVNSGDARFLGESRSHLGTLIYLTQNLHSLYEAMS